MINDAQEYMNYTGFLNDNGSFRLVLWPTSTSSTSTNEKFFLIYFFFYPEKGFGEGQQFQQEQHLT